MVREKHSLTCIFHSGSWEPGSQKAVCFHIKNEREDMIYEKNRKLKETRIRISGRDDAVIHGVIARDSLCGRT